MTPQPLPMLKPFADAVAYQLRRVPVPRRVYDRLSNEAKQRAFTVAGMTRQSVLEEAFRLAQKAIAESQTKREFEDAIGDLLDRNGGTILSPQRIELISQNNHAAAYAAGRFAQMNDPDITSERPYRQYPLGPHDIRTSQICIALEGLVARFDDPVWNHITPPNHHNERHLVVTTLTEEQAKETGKIYSSPGDLEYPHVDGRTILPDPGFDFAPGLVSADDRYLAEIAYELGQVVPAKTPADYGLQLLADVDVAKLPDAPRITAQAISDVTSAEEYARAWDSFRSAVGIADDATQTIVIDTFGDGVRINDRTFDHMLGLDADDAAREQKKDRPQWFGRIVPTITEPFETWMLHRKNAAGDLRFTKRYIGLYRDGKKKSAFVMFADLSREGWLMEAGFASTKNLERLRGGLLLQTSAGRKK